MRIKNNRRKWVWILALSTLTLVFGIAIRRPVQLISLCFLRQRTAVERGLARIDSSADDRIWECQNYNWVEYNGSFLMDASRELLSLGYRPLDLTESTAYYEGSGGEQVLVSASKSEQLQHGRAFRVKVFVGVPLQPTLTNELRLALQKLGGQRMIAPL